MTDINEALQTQAFFSLSFLRIGCAARDKSFCSRVSAVSLETVNRRGETRDIPLTRNVPSPASSITVSQQEINMKLVCISDTVFLNEIKGTLPDVILFSIYI